MGTAFALAAVLLVLQQQYRTLRVLTMPTPSTSTLMLQFLSNSDGYMQQLTLGPAVVKHAAAVLVTPQRGAAASRQRMPHLVCLNCLVTGVQCITCNALH
jgi:hypothetical protein